MSKLIKLKKLVSNKALSRFSPDLENCGVRIEGNTAVLMGLKRPLSKPGRRFVTGELKSNVSSVKSVAAYYHNSESGRVLRNPNGSLKAEFYHLDSDADRAVLQDKTSRIGNLVFKFNAWETYFVANQVVTQ